jgi:AcrR family transcriptional regulator
MCCCNMSSVTTKRAYNSSRRAAQAAQTRADVLAAAVEAFRESGWAGTTLNAVAARAGVAVETIYHAFGTKKRLLREAMDVAVVGDAEPIPLVDRPEWAEMQRGSRAERIAKGVALNTDIQERSAHVWRAIVEAAHSEPDVAAVQDEIEAGRAHDLKLGLELVLRKPVDGPVYDVLFALYGPETYVLLTERRGLSRAEYETVIAETTLKLVG